MLNRHLLCSGALVSYCYLCDVNKSCLSPASHLSSPSVLHCSLSVGHRIFRKLLLLVFVLAERELSTLGTAAVHRDKTGIKRRRGGSAKIHVLNCKNGCTEAPDTVCLLSVCVCASRNALIVYQLCTLYPVTLSLLK